MKKRKQTPEMRAGRMARNAATLIEQRGWAKGSTMTEEGGLCIRAALAVAYHGNVGKWHDDDSLKGSCAIFAKWLFPDHGATSSPTIAPSVVHHWNDARNPRREPAASLLLPGFNPDTSYNINTARYGAPRFPPPQSEHEVVAILRKFADEMDPQ